MPQHTSYGIRWCAALAGVLLFAFSTGCQTIQGEAKGGAATPAFEANPISSTSNTAGNYAGTFTYAGEPKTAGYPNSLTRLANLAFLVAYDEQRKTPAWAAYRIPGGRKYGPMPRPSRFSTDIRTKARVTHDDYTHTGYDRGHMVPNLAIASRFGAEAQAETFLMSNVAPQKPALNQGPWRLLEETIAETTAPHCAEIWVIVGPIYGSPGRKLRNGTVVPSAFFMIITDETEQGPRLQAFIMPQTTTRGENFRNYRTTVLDVQVKTGLDFFWALPDELENKLEAEMADYWLENYSR